MKSCIKCNDVKNENEFEKRVDTGNVRSECKKCRKKYHTIHMQKWRMTNKGNLSIRKSKTKYNNSKNGIEINREYQRKPKIKKYQQKYQKDKPEVFLRASIKLLTKLGKLFNVNAVEMKYALMSWSKTIKKKDNNKCQICESTNNLHSHHIFHKSKYPQLSLNLNNGITLCKDCHGRTHGYNTLILCN